MSDKSNDCCARGGVIVGHQAPDFCVPAVLADGQIVDEFKFLDAIKGKYAILFFYPLDFTFVCPSELIAFDHAMAELKKRGVEVVGVSIDSHFTHNAWRNMPIEKGGIGQVQYTLASDMKHDILRAYGIESSGGVAFRASFFIDPDSVVRAQIVNDLPIGRSIDEHIRLIDAIQFHEKHGEVCPMNWQPGKEGMKATPDGVVDYLSKNADQL